MLIKKNNWKTEGKDLLSYCTANHTQKANKKIDTFKKHKKAYTRQMRKYISIDMSKSTLF